ncbi:MAG TPA: GDP-mannose 4,6-dehydratase [Kofleriaceae bacterium]
MSKRAFITGIAGQDAAYLSKLLLDKGYEVFGGFRGSVSTDFWRLRELGIDRDVKLMPFELLEYSNIHRTFEKIRPDEVYNLAAQSFVSLSFDQPVLTTNLNAMGPLHVLEALRTVNPQIRFYQASTSEMFGRTSDPLQSEQSKFHPRSPYGVAKLFGFWITVNYREAYALHASNGILFNHDSPLRGSEFVTRKITSSMVRIALGQQKELVLGNTRAYRDWGFAGDYVDAMWRMLQQPTGDDYVVATGESHSVEDFVNAAAAHLDIPLRWEGEGLERHAINARTNAVVVRVAPEFYRPAEVDTTKGDSTKARAKLQWNPSTTFEQLVSMMVDADMQRTKANVT